MMESYLLSSVLVDDAPQGENIKSKRRKKGGAAANSKKRRLSDEQAKFLELSFKKERKLECRRKESLASVLGLDPKQVAVWFQNRRARWRSKQLEQKYHRLKHEHEEIVMEKCQLENEVLKLKERLSETEEEIGRLSVGITIRASNDDRSMKNSSSSLSTVTYQAAEEEININEYFIFMNDFMCSNYWMGWDDFSGMY